jgi:hypothetical protein
MVGTAKSSNLTQTWSLKTQGLSYNGINNTCDNCDAFISSGYPVIGVSKKEW